MTATAEKGTSGTGLLFYFCKGELSLQLSGMFNNDGVHRVLKGKDYQIVYMEFPFIYPFVDEATGYTKN